MFHVPNPLKPDFDSLPDYFRVIRHANLQQHVLGFQDPRSASGADIQMYTANEVLSLADAAQAHYDSLQSLVLSATNAQGDGPVAALAAHGQINWAASFIALVRLGFTVLALSPNLSGSALQALLLKAKAKVLVHGEAITPPPIEELIVVPIITNEDVQRPIGSITARNDDSQHEAPETGFIWHSSGSTGLPKLFRIPQSTAVQRVKTAESLRVPNHSLWVTSSLYNSAGLTFFLTALCRPTPTFFWDDSSDQSPDRLAAFLEAADAKITSFLPSVLARMASTEKGLQLLRTRDRVATFGAVCPKALGDRLTKEGIHLSVTYAMSETGTLMTSASRPLGDDDWQFMMLSPVARPYVHMQPFVKGATARGNEGIELFECVVLKGHPNTPESMSNSNDPPGSFYTGDVFEKHPTKSDSWRIVGRKDDQINMGLPVVISALEYEETIKAGLELDIEELVVFGDGRVELGVVVFVQPEQIGSSAVIKDAIWQSAQNHLNKKEQVGIPQALILIVSGELPRTDKGNFVRSLVYRQYEDLIAQAYASREQVGSPNLEL